MTTFAKFLGSALLVAMIAGCGDGDASDEPRLAGDEPDYVPQQATCWTWEEYDQDTEEEVIQIYCGRRWGRAYYQYEANGCITVTIQCYSDGGYITS